MNKIKIKHDDAIGDVLYALDTLRESPDIQGIIPGCDCGCGGDYFDFDAYEEDHEHAMETLARFGIEIVE